MYSSVESAQQRQEGGCLVVLDCKLYKEHSRFSVAAAAVCFKGTRLQPMLVSRGWGQLSWSEPALAQQQVLIPAAYNVPCTTEA